MSARQERPAGRRRPPRGNRVAGAIAQAPFRQFSMPYRPIEVLSADQIEAIHDSALTILETIGVRVLEPRARAFYAGAGASVDEAEMLVRLDRHLVEELIGKAPAAFTLEARNPAHNVKVGGTDAFFSAVGGPAYVSDLEKGRRQGTYAESRDFIRLVQALNILHQEGGGPFEALDLPPSTRHLDLYFAEITLTDKNWQPQTLGASRTLDALEMAAISFGVTREALNGKGRVHRHHQHELALAARHSHGGRADRAGRAQPGRRHHALHAGRRHVAGDAGWGHIAAARRSAGGHGARPDRPGRERRWSMAALPQTST